MLRSRHEKSHRLVKRGNGQKIQSRVANGGLDGGRKNKANFPWKRANFGGKNGRRVPTRPGNKFTAALISISPRNKYADTYFCFARKRIRRAEKNRRRVLRSSEIYENFRCYEFFVITQWSVFRVLF